MEQMHHGKSRGRFLQELTWNAYISPTKLKIFYTGTRKFDNVLAIYLSKILFHSEIMLFTYVHYTEVSCYDCCHRTGRHGPWTGHVWFLDAGSVIAKVDEEMYAV